MRTSALVLATSILIASVSIAWAQNRPPTRSNAIQACAKKKTGALRLLRSGKKCTSKERRVSWGQTGPGGGAGPQGVSGANGSNATVNGVAAGGDLTGTYPSPTIAPGAVTSSKLGTLTGLSFAPSTTPDGGIAFGSDTNLYRVFPDILRTDDDLVAGSGLSAANGTDVLLENAGATRIRVDGDGHLVFLRTDGEAFIEMREQTTDPAAPAANSARLYLQDAANKTQLVVRFATGAEQVIATEPP